MYDMTEMTLESFVKDLASNSPAPGGGSVAGLTGALSAALSSMVFSLTIGKKFYFELDCIVKDKIDNSFKAANIYKDEFLNLMDDDVKAFNKLIEAFKMPKNNDDEKAKRSMKIQEGYILAMKVPLEIARKSIMIYDFLEIAAKYGNPNAISDAGVGALLAQVAIESAVLNVRINLSSIKDKGMVDMISKECKELVEGGNGKKAYIMELVEGKL